MTNMAASTTTCRRPQLSAFHLSCRIETTGVRVPAFVISPWVAPASVFGYDDPVVNPGGSDAPTHAEAGLLAPKVGGLHFDHTSILKTIARRFLSTHPPYMGARYAAANDLSIVIAATLHEPQFRPFIPYRFEFEASGLMLDVQFAARGAGTPLWQYGANQGIAQDFSFEDAGDGYVHIRSHVSNLYVTVNVPEPLVMDVDSPAPPMSSGLGIIPRTSST